MCSARFEWCHFFRCSGPRVEESHLHDFDELVTFTEGRADVKVGGDILSPRAGDVVLYRSGVRHWEANDPANQPAFYVIRFRWDSIPADIPHVVQDRYGRVRTICQWLNERWWWQGGLDPLYPSALLDAIFAELMHAVWASSNEFVESVRRHMADNIGHRLTIQDLARHAGMSRSRFCREYRSIARTTPMAELRRIRMAQARNLLQTTDLPMKAVAEMVGLSDEASLSHLFRKYLSMTPSEIRQGSGKTREETLHDFINGLTER